MKKLESMSIRPAANGGHTITHEFAREVASKKMGDMYMERPKEEQNVFGPGDGAAALAHVAQHTGMKAGKMPKGTDCPCCGTAGI